MDDSSEIAQFPQAVQASFTGSLDLPLERRTMRTDLTVRAVHLGDMRIDVHIRGTVLPMDYPAEADKAPTPLEVLLELGGLRRQYAESGALPEDGSQA